MKKKNKATSSVILIIFALGMIYISNINDKSSNSSSHNDDYDSSVEKFTVNWPTPIDEARGDSLSDRLDRKNYYIIFDGSGSMGNSECSGGRTKEEVAKDALNNFVGQIADDDNIGLYIFDNYGSSERVPLGNNNKTQILTEIQKSKAGGRTPLKSSIGKGVTELARQSGRQLEYGEYHLVIITDGEASEHENPVNVVTTSLNETPIIIHSIGFCIDEKHSLNQPGKTIYKSADNPQALMKGLESVLAESEEFVVTDFEN